MRRELICRDGLYGGRDEQGVPGSHLEAGGRLWVCALIIAGIAVAVLLSACVVQALA